MPWPTPQEYNEALQNPALSFDDVDLRSGTVELTALGLPRPITGNFASVYRLRCPSGDWAVRCFWREYADMQDRYAAISRHLKAARLPYTVGFEYLPRGIRIRCVWYPTQKMEWVERRLLDEYVREHLDDRGALSRLASGWLEMVSTLARSGIAHGDLQHGNVLIVGDRLKLVDYDCMFVPKLAGRTSHELGHQNYQHPARTAVDFGPHLDRFAGRVIYLSLVALSIEPSLWNQVDGGEECLLLRSADFASSDSRALSMLSEHRDPRVKKLARDLRDALRAAPEDVPALERPGPPEWMRRHAPRPLLARVTGMFGSERQPMEVLPAPAPPSWLQDHLAAGAQTRRTFTRSFAIPRACTGLCVAALVVSTRLTPPFAHAVPPHLPLTWFLVILIQCLVLGLSFRRDPAVSEARALRAREKRDLRHLGATEGRVRRFERMKTREESLCRRRCERLARRRALRQEKERAKRGYAEMSLEHQVRLVADLHAELDRGERDQLKSMLEEEQQRYISAYLRSRPLRAATIPGVSWRAKIRLWLSGVRCAADVNTAHSGVLKAIEHGRALIAWRAAIQAEAKRTMPRSLTVIQRKPIVDRHAKRRKRLLSYQERVEETHARVLRRLSDHYLVAYTATDDRIEAAIQLCDERCRRLEAKMEGLQEELPRLYRELAEIRQRLELFHGVKARSYVAAALCPWLIRAR